MLNTHPKVIKFIQSFNLLLKIKLFLISVNKNVGSKELY